MKGNIKHILIDVDGVIADFVTDALKVHGCDPSFSVDRWEFYEDMGLTLDQFWEKIDEVGESFWVNLKAYPWIDDLLNMVHEYGDYTLSTSPSLDPSCYSGKRKWIQKHFGERYTKCMIGGQKYLMAKPGVVLIDDSEENVRKFERHGGHAILFPATHNKLRGVDRIPYVREQLDLIHAMA